MRIVKLIFLILPFITIVSTQAQSSKFVVAEFGNYKIYMDEFENAYAKSTGGIEKAKKDSLSTLQKFLDLYVNYKMKLRNAEVRGYEKDEDMKKELIEYKSNLGTTILLEKQLYEPNLKKLYERRKTEYRASHIMLIPDSAMNDEKTSELAKNLIQRIKNGEDFNTLVQEYSKDNFTNKTGGDVYYFTAGQLNVPELEDLVYNLNAGQIASTPFHYGNTYHIIKITEKQPRISSIRAKHILIKFADSTNVSDSTKALKKIKDIQEKLKNGADFSELARKYSDDKGSSVNGGDLNFFSRGGMVRQFDEVAFKLKKGEISDIVKTQFGYHLIQLTDISSYPSFESEKEGLRGMYQRIRYKQDYDNFVDKLKTEFNYKLNQNTFGKIANRSGDTVKVDQGYWKSNFQKEVGKLPIFSINGKDYIIDTLFSYMLRKNMLNAKKVDPSLIDEAVRNYSGDLAIQQKALVYDKENLEFAELINEYEKGMYLFKLMDDEVWTKVVADSSKIESFWKENKQNYKWKDRVEFKEIHTQSDSVINKCYSMVISGMNYDSIYVKLNERTGTESKLGYSGLVEFDVNELAKQANALKNIGDVSKPFIIDGGWSIVKLVKKESARPKTFIEAKAEAASQFQEKESKRLEEAYINSLKNLYHPKIYYDELTKAFK